MIDVSIVVPTLDAADFLSDCLASVDALGARELIIVDGGSTDNTIEIAREHGATLLRHDGPGVASARQTGIDAARSRYVFLLDSDVVLPPNALDEMLDELKGSRLTGLQARLQSISTGPGYWGRALARHHTWGKADNEWFGFAATLLARRTLLRYAFDPTLPSGEDAELRRRLLRAGARLRVSTRTLALHRFGDSFAFARAQWSDDGIGLAAMLHRHGWPVGWLAGMPLAAAARGMWLSVVHQEPQWIPFYFCLAGFNYAGMVTEVTRRRSVEHVVDRDHN